MKTNKAIIYPLMAIYMLLNSSCEDVLDKRPLNMMTENDVWGDINLAQAAIYRFYGNINYFSKWTGDGRTRGSDNQTDILWGHWVQNADTDDSGWTTSTDFGWDAFGDVRNANVAITKMKDDDIRNYLSTSVADNLLGQAYLLKAGTYYKQARKFGGWIIVDELLDEYGNLASSDENVAQKLKLPRATMKETYDYAITMCEDAVRLMNVKNKNGELSKGAAYALLSEIALHGAVYMKHFENADPEPYLQKAVTAVEQLNALGLYSLVGGIDYGNMFRNYTYASSCPEIIFYTQRNSLYSTSTDEEIRHLAHDIAKSRMNLSAFNYDFQPLDGFETDGYGVISPTPQHIERAYYVIDTDGNARRFEESFLFKDNVDIVTEEDLYQSGQIRQKRKLKPSSTYTSISDLLYQNRDQRFYQNIAYDGSEYLNNIIYMRSGGNAHPLSSNHPTARERGTVTGYMYKKYLPQSNVLDRNNIDITRPVFRLGRCYLNAAEALIHLGRDAEARNYINKTRTVHGGLPALTDESGDVLKKIYIDERDAELDLEGDRYFTLLRTSIAWGPVQENGFPDVANKAGVIPVINNGAQNGENSAALEIEIPGDYRTEADFRKPNAYFLRELYAPQTDRIFNFNAKKRYLLPVRMSELEQNENLWQNDNWK
jgi:hypothetical protein